jgi:hypothetical protein
MTATPYASITDGSTTVNFVGNPDLKSILHSNGAAYDPLGYGFTVVSVDVIREGVTWTMVAIPSTQTNDDALKALLKGGNELTITYPDGVTTMNVVVDPATDPAGEEQFSTILWQLVNTWTVKFWQSS